MDYTLKSEQFLGNLVKTLKRLFIPTKKNNYRPQFLESRGMAWAVVFVVVVKVATIAAHFPFPSNIFFADITKAHLVQLLNNDRQAQGLSTLVPNEKLNQAALLKAQDMVAKGYFSHYSPEGITPWFWISQTGYKYAYAGENLAVGFADSEIVYQAWKDSPSHNANLFQPKYTEVGTAVLQGFGGSSIVVVQLFGSPKNAIAAALPKPQSPPSVAPTPKDIQAVQPAQEEIAQEPQSSPRVLAGSTGYAITKDAGNTGSGLYVRFLSFMVYNDKAVAQYGIYALLLIIGSSLLLTIVIHFEVQHKKLITRSLALMAVLAVTASFDAGMVNMLFPHYIAI